MQAAWLILRICRQYCGDRKRPRFYQLGIARALLRHNGFRLLTSYDHRKKMWH